MSSVSSFQTPHGIGLAYVSGEIFQFYYTGLKFWLYIMFGLMPICVLMLKPCFSGSIMLLVTRKMNSIILPVRKIT